MSLHNIELKISKNDYDIALGVLVYMNMTGCEEKENSEGVFISAGFDDYDSAKLAYDELKRINSSWTPTIVKTPITDWNAKWKKSIEPVKITDNIWVAPLWRPPVLKNNEKWIKIEPKMAFGTGHHETTRLTAQAIIRIGDSLSDSDNANLLDIGTGSGILSFCASYTKFKHTVGIEISVDCLDNLAENRIANNQLIPQSFFIGTMKSLKFSKQFDVIAMNMIMPKSEPLLPDIMQRLKANGTFIWSGILVEEKSEAIEVAHAQGFNLTKESSEKEWWCGEFRKSIF